MSEQSISFKLYEHNICTHGDAPPGQGGAAAENAVRYAESHVILAGVVVLAGILLSVGKIIFGAWRDKIRSKPKPKHAAW